MSKKNKSLDKAQKLFDQPHPLDKVTCFTCEHRQRHQCNSVVIQYCGVRKSNRTDNGLLKIKCKTKACSLYEPME